MGTKSVRKSTSSFLCHLYILPQVQAHIRVKITPVMYEGGASRAMQVLVLNTRTHSLTSSLFQVFYSVALPLGYRAVLGPHEVRRPPVQVPHEGNSYEHEDFPLTTLFLCQASLYSCLSVGKQGRTLQVPHGVTRAPQGGEERV